MGRIRNATRNWIEKTTKFEISWSPAPAPPPWDSHKQEDELQFLRDSHYFMHGEIIAITAITVFVIFLLFLFLPCLRRTITNIPSSASAAAPHDTPSSDKTKVRSWNGKTDELQFEHGKTTSAGSEILLQPATGNSSYC